MFIIVRKSDASIQKIADNKITTNHIANDSANSILLDVIEAANYDEKQTIAYNCIYYIFDGELHLRITNKETIVYKGDAVFIEKGMTVALKGTFKAITISHPELRL